MKKIYEYLVWSSVNADKISLTAKGAFSFFASIAIPALAYAGITRIAPGDITNLELYALALVQAVLGAVSALVVIVGFARKLYTSLKGTNQSLA